MTVLEIQKALRDAGFNPGPIDGIRGRKTILAIESFQRANGLVADGIVGPKTAAKLFSKIPASQPFAIPATIPWLEEAYRLIGTQEQKGPDSNKNIIRWAEDLEISGYGSDDIAWCGLFVGHCIASQLPNESLPSNPLGARNWANFGSKTEASLGAVMVFWRGSKDGWQGHVGFYWAEDKEAYHILGGNQSDKVCITRIAKTRLLAARWPSSAPHYVVHREADASNGNLLSQNEA